MKNTIAIIILALLATGCTPSTKERNDIPLFHEVIELPETIIGDTYSIQKMGDFLVILDYSTDSFFHLINLKDRTDKGMYGSKGQGPNDFIHPGRLHPYSENQLCCFDNAKGEIRLLTVDTNSETIECSTLYSIKQNLAFEVIPAGHDTLLINGIFENSMFQLATLQNEILSSSEEYPYKDEEEHKISNRLRAMAYQGCLSMNKLKKFAYATSNAYQIYFYQIKGNQLVKSGEVIKSYGRYIPDGNTSGYSVVNDGNSPECFTDLAVTENHVYALYSGRTFKEYRHSYRDSKYLFVYDWSGKPVKSYTLDVPILCFCIDEEEQKIYAIANLPDPTLVVFPL